MHCSFSVSGTHVPEARRPGGDVPLDSAGWRLPLRGDVSQPATHDVDGDPGWRRGQVAWPGSNTPAGSASLRQAGWSPATWRHPVQVWGFFGTHNQTPRGKTQPRTQPQHFGRRKFPNTHLTVPQSVEGWVKVRTVPEAVYRKSLRQRERERSACSAIRAWDLSQTCLPIRSTATCTFNLYQRPAKQHASAA